MAGTLTADMIKIPQVPCCVMCLPYTLLITSKNLLNDGMNDHHHQLTLILFSLERIDDVLELNFLRIMCQLLASSSHQANLCLITSGLQVHEIITKCAITHFQNMIQRKNANPDESPSLEHLKSKLTTTDLEHS